MFFKNNSYIYKFIKNPDYIVGFVFEDQLQIFWLT